jgi:hypothetical protein
MLQQITVSAWTYGASTEGFEAYEGGAWREPRQELATPFVPPTWTYPAELQLLDREHPNQQLALATAAYRWAWEGLAMFPDLPELHMVRQSLLRDLSFTASSNASWTEKQLRQSCADLEAAARHSDGTEISLNRVESLELHMEQLEDQLEDWTLFARGFRTAMVRFDAKAVPLPPTWSAIHRPARQARITDWALSFESQCLDNPDGHRDHVIERLYWALCNMAHRNMRWTEKGWKKAKSPGRVKMWRIQLEAWRTMAPAFERAYHRATGNTYVPPAAHDAEVTERGILASVAYTAEQRLQAFRARYGELPQIADHRAHRTDEMRMQAIRDRVRAAEGNIGLTEPEVKSLADLDAKTRARLRAA